MKSPDDGHTCAKELATWYEVSISDMVDIWNSEKWSSLGSLLFHPDTGIDEFKSRRLTEPLVMLNRYFKVLTSHHGILPLTKSGTPSHNSPSSPSKESPLWMTQWTDTPYASFCHGGREVIWVKYAFGRRGFSLIDLDTNEYYTDCFTPPPSPPCGGIIGWIKDTKRWSCR